MFIESSGSTRYNRDLFLAKTINGDTVWTKKYGLGIGTLSSPDQEGSTAIIKTHDNNLVLLGFTNYGGNSTQIYLLKVGLDGALLWQQTYGGGRYCL